MREVHVSGVYAIISAIIGAILGALATAIVAPYITPGTGNLNDDYKYLQLIYNELKNEYIKLENENVSLSEENTSLQTTISNLKDEIETIKYNMLGNENNINDESTNNNSNISNISSYDFAKKISIFDLDTFQGEAFWYSLSDNDANEEELTDTYGNKYLKGHTTYHYGKTKDSIYVPTYLLDYKYTMCEGKIAWSKEYKNNDNSCWIDFYSGDKLIYTTDIITATRRLFQVLCKLKNLT